MHQLFTLGEAAMRLGILFSSLAYWLLGRYFIAGRTRKEALHKAKELREQGFGVTLNVLGEHHKNLEEVQAATREYCELVGDMREILVGGSVALKPTQIGLSISEERFKKNLGLILELARAHGVDVEVDTEALAYLEPTLEAFSFFASDSRYSAMLRIAIQANVVNIAALMRKYGIEGCRVRLVKGGAYENSPELINDESKIRDAFLSIASRLIFGKGFPKFQPIYLATVRDRILVKRVKQELPDPRVLPVWQFQMLYGPWTKLQQELLREGYQITLYVPYGTQWFSYGMRRWKFLWKVLRESVRFGASSR